MAIEGKRLLSKTQHYRKVTKPLLERKRRARMNLYLDELKDLIVDTMEEQGEHVTKLEKADILEMTVQYLKSKKQFEENNAKPNVDSEKFQAGYTQAAHEVSKVFASFPGLDFKFGTKLMKHLGYQLKDMKAMPNSPNAATCSERASIVYRPDQLANRDMNLTQRPEEPQLGEVWRPW